MKRVSYPGRGVSPWSGTRVLTHGGGPDDDRSTCRVRRLRRQRSRTVRNAPTRLALYSLKALDRGYALVIRPRRWMMKVVHGTGGLSLIQPARILLPIETQPVTTQQRDESRSTDLATARCSIWEPGERIYRATPAGAQKATAPTSLFQHCRPRYKGRGLPGEGPDLQEMDAVLPGVWPGAGGLPAHCRERDFVARGLAIRFQHGSVAPFVRPVDVSGLARACYDERKHQKPGAMCRYSFAGVTNQTVEGLGFGLRLRGQ